MESNTGVKFMVATLRPLYRTYNYASRVRPNRPPCSPLAHLPFAMALAGPECRNALYHRLVLRHEHDIRYKRHNMGWQR